MSPRQIRWLRVSAVIALVGALVLVERAFGLGELLSRDALRAQVAAAGSLGVPLFVAAFCVALLLHVPATGILFVAVGVALYGRLAGGLLAYGGALVAVLVSFAIVRGVGGRPLAAIRRPALRRILDRLESHPVLTVIVLRLLFLAGAPVNYALALSPIRPRDYAVGSLLGLAPPVAVLSLFFDVLIG